MTTESWLQSPKAYKVELLSSLREGSCNCYYELGTIAKLSNYALGLWLTTQHATVLTQERHKLDSNWCFFKCLFFSSGNQGDNITDWYGELLSRSIPRANTITDCMLYKRVCFVLRGGGWSTNGEIRCWIKQLQRKEAVTCTRRKDGLWKHGEMICFVVLSDMVERSNKAWWAKEVI